MTTIAQWTSDLLHNDLRVRLAAAEALAGVAADAQPAIVALVQALGSGDHEVINWCTAALEEVGPPAVSQIDDLKSLADSDVEDVAFWAITLLGRAGKRAENAVPVVAGRLADDAAPAVQARAAWALGKMGPAAAAALPALRPATARTGALASHAQRAVERLEDLRS